MMKTTFLMTAMTILLVLIGDYFGGRMGMLFMLAISLGTNFFAYWNSDKMVLAQYNARPVTPEGAPGLYKMVERLAKRAGLPMPKLYVIDSQSPNAFATGRDPEHAAVAVTTALVNALEPEEVEGVIAHELSHVKHSDILIGTVAASMAGIITTIAHWGAFFGGGRDGENRNPIVGLVIMLLAPIAASIIQLAVSRSREYLADKSGGELCGNPNALANALLKIQNFAEHRKLANASENTAHMFIICPFSKKDMASLFSTHPSTEERVKLLREQAEEMKRAGKLK